MSHTKLQGCCLAVSVSDQAKADQPPSSAATVALFVQRGADDAPVNLRLLLPTLTCVFIFCSSNDKSFNRGNLNRTQSIERQGQC